MKANKNYTNRLVEKEVDLLLQSFPCVSIEGPKWCGKTWLGQHFSKSACYMDDPSNNFQNIRRANISPDLILDGDNPRLIDEWQLVPSIWDAIRHNVDQSTGKGKYIITGSTKPPNYDKYHSGAGRISKFRLTTMSLYETGDSTGQVCLVDLFNNEIKPQNTGEVLLEELIFYVVRGGWPGSLGLNRKQASKIPSEYLNTVLTEDIPQFSEKNRNVEKIKMLLKSLARNESTIAGKKTLAKDISENDGILIGTNTVSEYLDELDNLYLINNQPTFNPNMRSSVRVGKTPKRHFVDVSLAVAALGATTDSLYNDLETFGFLFEALCEHDLEIYAKYHGGQLFHYRDGLNREIDAVVELPDSRWIAIEIKLGNNQIDAAAKSLLHLQKDMENDNTANPPAALVVICGLTDFAYQREDGVIVVPITALRP